MYPPELPEPTRQPSYTRRKRKQLDRRLAYRGAILSSRPPTRTAKESGRRVSREERASGLIAGSQRRRRRSRIQTRKHARKRREEGRATGYSRRRQPTSGGWRRRREALAGFGIRSVGGFWENGGAVRVGPQTGGVAAWGSRDSSVPTRLPPHLAACLPGGAGGRGPAGGTGPVCLGPVTVGHSLSLNSNERSR